MRRILWPVLLCATLLCLGAYAERQARHASSKKTTAPEITVLLFRHPDYRRNFGRPAGSAGISPERAFDGISLPGPFVDAVAAAPDGVVRF